MPKFYIQFKNLKPFVCFLSEPPLSSSNVYQRDASCNGDYESFSCSEIPADQILWNMLFKVYLINCDFRLKRSCQLSFPKIYKYYLNLTSITLTLFLNSQLYNIWKSIRIKYNIVKILNTKCLS